MSELFLPDREIIRVGASNLLNNADLPHCSPQSERKWALVDLINSVKPESGAFIQFLSEAVDEPTIDCIAAETDSVLVGDPVEYCKDYSYMAFLADKNTQAKATTKFTATASEKDTDSKTNQENNLGFLTMDVDELSLFGFHPPHMPWGYHRTERNFMFKKIGEAANMSKQAILLGDSNMSPLYPTRRDLLRKGFIEAHATDRPPFPSFSGFRGKTMRRYTPNSSLDIIFFRGQGLRLVNSGYASSKASDHPTVWADLLVTS